MQRTWRCSHFYGASEPFGNDRSLSELLDGETARTSERADRRTVSIVPFDWPAPVCGVRRRNGIWFGLWYLRGENRDD
jgi:hypothetical protein